MKERGKVNTFMKNFFRIFSECAIIGESYISGGFALPETLEQIVELFAQNLRRYLNGEPLGNLVDLRTGYRA